jgi:hypothetical protein
MAEEEELVFVFNWCYAPSSRAKVELLSDHARCNLAARLSCFTLGKVN